LKFLGNCQVDSKNWILLVMCKIYLNSLSYGIGNKGITVNWSQFWSKEIQLIMSKWKTYFLQ
jgi:hypothetical protein